MAILSIVLSLVAGACTVLGFLTTPIPVVGVIFSFGAAAVAVAGIMLGGKAVSAAKKEGLPNDAARIGVVLNVVALVPAVLVAVTCGVCNAVVSSGKLQVNKDFRIDMGGPGFTQAAGAEALPGPHETAGSDAPVGPDSPLPPPPLPAGPRGTGHK